MYLRAPGWPRLSTVAYAVLRSSAKNGMSSLLSMLAVFMTNPFTAAHYNAQHRPHTTYPPTAQLSSLMSM
jgi:hypothetical protein